MERGFLYEGEMGALVGGVTSFVRVIVNGAGNVLRYGVKGR